MSNKNERRRALIELQQEISTCRRCVEAGFIPVAHPIFRGDSPRWGEVARRAGGRQIEQRWMILGQAPGAAAETHARPYSGASGKTLRGWLSQAGIEEAAFYERFYLNKVYWYIVPRSIV